MLDLFRVETENQSIILTAGLLDLERNADSVHQFEGLMRAAHSLKGAARIVDNHRIEQLAHAMEDCFVAGREGRAHFGKPEIDILLQGVDVLLKYSRATEAQNREDDRSADELEAMLDVLR